MKGIYLLFSNVAPFPRRDNLVNKGPFFYEKWIWWFVYFSFNQCTSLIMALLRLVYCEEMFFRWAIWPMYLLFFCFFCIRQVYTFRFRADFASTTSDVTSVSSLVNQNGTGGSGNGFETFVEHEIGKNFIFSLSLSLSLSRCNCI